MQATKDNVNLATTTPEKFSEKTETVLPTISAIFIRNRFALLKLDFQ